MKEKTNLIALVCDLSDINIEKNNKFTVWYFIWVFIVCQKKHIGGVTGMFKGEESINL